MTDGRVERGRATRERLVAAGREAFGQRGYGPTSIAEILEAAGVAKGALYHHFDTKAALFDAVLDRVVQEMSLAAIAQARTQTDPAASLKAGCGAWLELTLDPTVRRIVLVDAVAVVGWSRLREIDEHHAVHGIRVNLERLAGGDREADLDLLAHMVLAAVGEAAFFVARAAEPPAALAVARRTVDALIDRIAT